MSLLNKQKISKGLRDPLRAARYVNRKARHRWLLRKAPNIFERDWDVLVVLDACRYDSLRDATETRENYGPVSSYISVAGHSTGWLSTYREELAQDNMLYVSSNPNTDDHLNRAGCIEVWKTGWDDELGTVRAEEMTNAAIAHYEDQSPERLVVHYMQPHFPSIPEPEVGAGMVPSNTNKEWVGSVWNLLEEGEIAVEPVREAYEANLRYVLDEVDVLATALDEEKTVVTADHGNAFEGPYGHPIESSARSVREVPWCVVECVQNPPRKPGGIDVSRETEQVDVEKRLSTLGYHE